MFKRARCPRSQGSDTGPRGCRVLGSRASRPPPAGGRQWTTRRRPTGVFKRARCPRSQGSGTGPCGCRVLGSRASRPHPAGGRRWTTRRRPTGCVQAGKMPALPGIRHRALWMPRPGIAGVPPAPGRRPAMDDPPKAHRVCSSGQDARAPRDPTPGLVDAASWDRGRPARTRPEAGNGRPAEGPPVCSSGQDARAPRDPAPGLVDAAYWDRGRPARTRPEAGDGRPAEGPPGVFKRARCPRSQESAHRERAFTANAVQE